VKANTYHLWTIGCQMNEADAWRAAAMLESAGYRPVEHARDAQFLLLSTCVVRQQAEDKILSRLKYVEELKRAEPSRTVALMGCFVGFRPGAGDELRERYPFVDLFVPPSATGELARWLAARTGSAEENTDPDGEPPPLPESLSGGRTVRANLPVVLGCSHACAYCIIPHRRGPERSRPADAVLAEARGLAGRGVREIVLLGQIVDRYGLDLGPGAPRLPELLRRVAGVPGIRRVRFLTSHPNWITPELVETVAGTPGLMPYFEIPVQAGSDAVLAAMRRGYTAGRYEELVAGLRERIPGVGISTDLIVGFPGETEAQFTESLDLMRRIDPDMIRVAKYSPRPNTLSARTMPDDVLPEEKERRRVAIESQLREMLEAKHAPRLGRTEEILVERIEPGGRRYGRTPDGKTVFVDACNAALGDVVRVKNTWTGAFSFIAEPA
jgi:tRNA-2-methylthio-N6-dimethylallyladenosine synthase